MLELARILKDTEMPYNIKFILFSGEEKYMLGSSVHEILHPEDRPAPQSSYSHYSGINYSALEVAVRRIQQDFDFLMRYLPKLPDDSYAKTETLKILKQHKAYMAQFEEMLNDKEIA